MLDDVIAWVAGDGFVYIFVIGLPLFLAVLVQQTCYGIRFLFRKFKAWRDRRRSRFTLYATFPDRPGEYYKVKDVQGTTFTMDRALPTSDLDALKARVEKLEECVQKSLDNGSTFASATNRRLEALERPINIEEVFLFSQKKIFEKNTFVSPSGSMNYAEWRALIDEGLKPRKAGHTAEQARAILAKAGYRWELCDRGELRPRWRVCQDGQFIGVFDHEWELLNTVGGYIGVGPVEPFDDDTPAGGSVPYKPR